MSPETIVPIQRNIELNNRQLVLLLWCIHHAERTTIKLLEEEICADFVNRMYRSANNADWREREL